MRRFLVEAVTMVRGRGAKKRARVRCVVLAAVAGLSSTAAGQTGPDLFTCLIGGTSNNSGWINYGGQNGLRAYSVLTVACNQGDVPLNWHDGSEGPENAHPVISQSIFRLRDGRFEQIGTSWVKHGYSAGQINFCTQCQPGGTQHTLGVGCCDAYGAAVNGSQARMGPRSEVNAATGVFPHPFCSPKDGGINCPSITTEMDRRLQAKQTDLDPSKGVMYFYEVHHITSDDVLIANPRNDYNNASYRRFAIDAQGDIALWTGEMVHMEPAIYAWKANGLGLDVVDPDILLSFVDVPDDGRFYIAAKATDLGDGRWRYDYAIQNFNSDRSGATLVIPLPDACDSSITGVGFHDVDYHSGEVYSSTDWAHSINADSISWSTESHATNVNANALRWGTLYNFWFEIDRSPTQGEATMALFKPGTPETMSLPTIVPNALACFGDIAPVLRDCEVGVPDLLAVINAWGACPTPPEPCTADLNIDTNVGVPDLLAIINAWGSCSG